MILWPIVGALVAIWLSATFSGMETGVYSLERVRLQLKAASGDRRAARLLALVQDPARAVCTILVVNNAVNYAVSSFCGDVVKQTAAPGLGEVELELLNTLWVVPILFVFGEVVPKQLFLGYPAALTARAWPLYRIGAILLRPVVTPLLALVSRLGTEDDALSRPLLARQGVAELLTAGDEAEALHASQRRMVRQVLALRAVTVNDRMVPAGAIASVERDADRDQVLAVAARSGRSRLLVASSEAGTFIGYVNALDAALAEPDPSWTAARGLVDLPTVTGSMPLLEALGVLQDARRPVAQVVEAGRAVGLLGQADIVRALLAPAPVSVSLSPRSTRGTT